VSRISGDPDRLAAYTAATLPQVNALRVLVGEYADAVAACNAAPDDLGSTVPDRSGAIDAALDDLHDLDRLPGAFGEALRVVDRFATALPAGLDWLGIAGTREERLLALTEARLQDPFAGEAQLFAAAEDRLRHGVVWPWRDGVLPWLAEGPTSSAWWTGTIVGLGTSVVDGAAKPTRQRGLLVPVRGHPSRGGWIDAHHRWRPGYARVMNRFASANTAARWGPRIGRAGNVAGVVLAGAGQAMEDADDASLTTGDRVARVGMTTATEGVVGAAGAYVGAAVGQALIPIPVVGAVIGGAVGGWIGGEVGGAANDNLAGATETLGNTIDDALDLGGDVLDSMGDLP